MIRGECVQLGGGGNLFAEIRLREIRCEVEVGRVSCALFAKAKVDARERLEFTEGSTPRERCLSVTTADTRECLEILVFLFLVTLSPSLSLLLSAVFSFSYHFTRAPREPLSRYSTFFVDIPIFEGRVRVGKKEGEARVGARVTRSASKLRKEAFSSRVGSSFDSYEEESIESKGNYSRPRLAFRNILILGETIRAQRREWKRRGKGEQKWVNTVAVTFKGRKEFVEGGKAYVSLLFPLPHRQIALSPRKLASRGGLFFPK